MCDLSTWLLQQYFSRSSCYSSQKSSGSAWFCSTRSHRLHSSIPLVQHIPCYKLSHHVLYSVLLHLGNKLFFAFPPNAMGIVVSAFQLLLHGIPFLVVYVITPSLCWDSRLCERLISSVLSSRLLKSLRPWVCASIWGALKVFRF